MNETQTTLIAPHTFFKGELHLSGPTSIAGRVEGAIVAEDALEITAEGQVEGDIQGVLVDIQGTVKGNVIATQACRLGASARVAGELRAANLAIAEGACFVGQVYVGGVRPEETAAPEESEAPAQVNRIESLAAEAEEIAETAAAATAPPVRIVNQAVQQTLHRAPRIIKAR